MPTMTMKASLRYLQAAGDLKLAEVRADVAMDRLLAWEVESKDVLAERRLRRNASAQAEAELLAAKANYLARTLICWILRVPLPAVIA